MKTNFYQKIILAISFIGVIFSGYLNATKFSALNCVTSNDCLYFIGYPIYWYNLGLFVLMFIVVALAIFEISSIRRIVVVEILLSLIGVFFVGYIALSDMLDVVGDMGSLFGIPLFIYNLILYLSIFVISINYINSKKKFTQIN